MFMERALWNSSLPPTPLTLQPKTELPCTARTTVFSPSPPASRSPASPFHDTVQVKIAIDSLPRFSHLLNLPSHRTLKLSLASRMGVFLPRSRSLRNLTRLHFVPEVKILGSLFFGTESPTALHSPL